MSKLTVSAKKTYASLVAGNLLIILAIIILGQYFHYMSMKPVVSESVARNMAKMVHVIKRKPESNWSNILNRHTIPWSKITLSQVPLYQDNALLNVQSFIISDLLEKNKQLQISVFIKEGAWLNISIMPPVPNQLGLWATGACFFLILIFALVLVNYFAVRVLNQPIQTLIQSLKYSERQDSWLPIPITGNSDQKQILRKINLLQEKVNKLLENRTRVVTAISHDLRTPLTRLKLRVEAFEGDPIFEKMMQDIYEMETMIRETLDYFSEVNAEEPMHRFDMVALLTSLAEDAADLHFEVSFHSELAKVVYVGHVALLKRAFSNLINNAIYYGQQVIVQLRQCDDYLEISISDHGPGLKAAELEQVFMPFYRAEHSRSRETGGVGLGLTIAKEIIQKHHGKISLHNRPEGGLQVLILLPFNRLLA